MVSCSTKNLRNKDHMRGMFDAIWRFHPEAIKHFDTEKGYFYEVINFYEQDNGKWNTEGEAVSRVYVIIADYGEYAEGIFVDLGTFFPLRDAVVDDSKKQLTITYGTGKEMKTKVVDLTPYFDRSKWILIPY